MIANKKTSSPAVRKLEDDLAYRLPNSVKPLSVIVLSRELAEQLLAEIYELQEKKGE